MIYMIPFVGWFLGLFFHISLAIPFWLCWNALAPKFFYWLPPVYHEIGFWETVGIFIILSILKLIFYPRIANSTNVENK